MIDVQQWVNAGGSHCYSPLADVQALAPHEVLDVLKDARIDHELSAWFCIHTMTWISNTTAE